MFYKYIIKKLTHIIYLYENTLTITDRYSK